MRRGRFGWRPCIHSSLAPVAPSCLIWIKPETEALRQHYDMDQPLLPGSVYGIQLMNLHTATRLLLLKIEGEELMGMPTRALRDELRVKERETRVFRAYLLASS